MPLAIDDSTLPPAGRIIARLTPVTKVVLFDGGTIA